MDEPALTFAEIHRRQAAIPEGSARALATPGRFHVLYAIGMAGTVLGLLPSVLVLWFAPQPWMVDMARLGLVVAVAGYAIPFFRAITVFAVSVRHWQRDQADDLDRFHGHHQRLVEWIASHPPQRVAQLLDFARQARSALADRLALLGGVEKLGLLPILVGVALHARAVVETAETHSWEGPIGVMLVLLYAITFIGNLMRQRLDLYVRLLERALPDHGKAHAH